jgi:DNA-binding XRE family transcriptional regulator
MTPAETAAELIRRHGSAGMVAKWTGVNPQTIRRIAAGKVEPRDRLANALAWHLEQTMRIVS